MMRQQVEFYKELIDNLPVAAVYVLDDKLFLNKKAVELTGYNSEDIACIDDWFAIYGNSGGEVRRVYTEAKQKGFPGTDRVLFPKKNGEVRVFDFTASLTSAVEVWVMIDVTEKILVEERFTVLFEHSTDAHLLFDKTGIVDGNNAAVRMLNAKNKEEILAHHPAYFSPEYQPCGMRSMDKNKLMDKIAHELRYHRFEWMHKKITGEEFLVEVTLNPVSVANKNMLLVVWHDLTDIKEAQKKLEEERSFHCHASKMATLGEMASGIAHEINNPLTIILNKATQITKALEQPEANIAESIKNSQKIVTTVDRISKIVKGLRNFARDGANETYARVSIKSIVTEVLDLCMARFVSNGIQLKLVTLPNESVLDTNILCVCVQIEQVLLNLLNNAHDASINEKSPEVELTVSCENQFVVITVTDSGQGVPVEIRDKIMLPFFTTKEIGKGTGIGLSISKGIIEKHKGQLYLDHAHNRTRFVVKLPIEN